MTTDEGMARRDAAEEPREAEPADRAEAIDDVRTTSPEPGTSAVLGQGTSRAGSKATRSSDDVEDGDVSAPVEVGDDSPDDDDDVGAGSGMTATELFLRVNSVIREDQALKTIEPGQPCSEGLRLLLENGFSQAPIARGRQVIGIFSYRSFSHAAASMSAGNPGAVPVEEAMEDPIWVRATDELGPLLDVLDARDAVLVGDEDDLQAIVTGMDVLRRLDSLSEPFIRLRGIELALRTLVNAAADAETLAALANGALSNEYAERPDEPPQATGDMTLGQLTSIVLYPASWRHMKETLGANRNNAITHLTGLSSLRNDVLHFRRELDQDELDRIKTTSDWLRTRMRAAGLAEAGE